MQRRGSIGSKAIAALAVLIPLALAGWWALGVWRERADREAAFAAVGREDHTTARPILERLAERRPEADDVQYALGLSAQALGDPAAAVAAWSRVPDRSAFAGRSALLRAREALAAHQYGAAEPLLLRASREPGAIGIEATQSLALIRKLQGRLGEVHRLFVERFADMPDPVATLRELWDLDHAPFPIESLRQALAQAGSATDPGLELARANLARRDGQLDDAARQLDALLTRPAGPGAEAALPTDPVVRAALEVARARDDAGAIARLANRLGPETLSPPEALELLAWSARRRGDADAERAALTDRVAVHPGSAAVLERLGELELKAGQGDLAAQRRAAKAELDAVGEQYRDRIFFATDPLAQAAELAGLARTLGRVDEARLLYTLALRRNPGDESSRDALIALGAATTPAAILARTTPAALQAAVARPEGASPADRGGTPADPSAARSGWLHLVDTAEATGLDFSYDPGRIRGRRLPETMGGGLAILDADGDGWLDVFAVQGGTFPPTADQPNTGDRLFRNRGDGTFEDVTDRSGLASVPRGYGLGVTAGDIDGDGHPDLFVTRWRSYALYRNRGDGTFEDVTDAWGLGGERDWPSSAALADLDADGDLDLYVCHYLVWSEQAPQGDRPDRSPDTSRYNNPLNYRAEPDHLFRNDGGRFVDVTAESGIVDREGRGLGVVAADLDADGRLDLYVANDLTANFLFRNLGGLRFEEVAATAGVAGNDEGGYQGSMGVACDDFDADGLPDLAVTNFYGDSMAFYRGLAPGVFADHAAQVGVKGPTRYMVGWGVAFLDADNDGRLDLIATNGHLDDPGRGLPFAMPTQLFLGTPEGRLVDVTARAGADLGRPRVGRALAVGDLDHDGRLETLLVGHDTPLVRLDHRPGPEAGGMPLRSIVLELASGPGRAEPIGARVSLVAEGDSRPQVRLRTGGGSYQSASSPRLHFGLGPAARARTIEVTWPDGQTQAFRDLPAGGYRIRPGAAEPEPLPGYGR